MNKSDLVKVVKDKLDVKTVEAKNVVDVVLHSIIDAVVAGEVVIVNELGRMQVKVRAARKSRNPRTGQSVDVPAKNFVHFKASSSFKKAVAK